jgi:Dolichyl-phosphate-mannose-protein mannosyltransferase
MMPLEERAGSRLLRLSIFLAIPLTLALALNLRVDRAKPLGFDELIVSRVASQPNFSDIWKILTSGQSPHPPLNFLAVRGVKALFGDTELTTRLPSTLGFAVMEVCLFFFVSQRSNAAFGTMAMLFPLVTLARVYAVEAKPYGALLGWTGIALICWRYAGDRDSRPRLRILALAGLGIALICATSSHFFGALLGIPILAGEAVRAVERRRVDWVLAAIITLNYWPLVFFAPILRAGSRIHGAHPWQTPLGFGFIFKSADLLLAEAAAPVLICLLIASASRARSHSQKPGVRFPADEIAVATALALLPVVAYCGLRLSGARIIEEKYLITMVVGVAILFAWSVYSAARSRLAVGILAAAVLGLWGGRDFTRDLRIAEDARIEAQTFSPPAEATCLGPLPIVVETPLFMQLETYARHEIADRVYLLLDPAASLKYLHTDAMQRSILLNPSFFGPHMEKLADFQATHHDFLIYEQLPDDPSWLLEKYKDDGARIELLKSGREQRWYRVRN